MVKRPAWVKAIDLLEATVTAGEAVKASKVSEARAVILIVKASVSGAVRAAKVSRVTEARAVTSIARLGVSAWKLPAATSIVKPGVSAGWLKEVSKARPLKVIAQAAVSEARAARATARAFAIAKAAKVINKPRALRATGKAPDRTPISRADKDKGSVADAKADKASAVAVAAVSADSGRRFGC